MNRISTFALLAAFTIAAPAYAQTDDTNVPGHPRVNEVDQRLENQQDRINAGEKNGTITQGQAARDEKRDANIAAQASKDEAKHGGHLTKGEDKRLNKELNKDSKDIHRQKDEGRERKEHRKEERKERREKREHEHHNMKEHHEGEGAPAPAAH
jgi:hypothetical protein